MKKFPTIVALWVLSIFVLPVAAIADDVFQQAVNYVFTGAIDPANPPEIVDRKACIVVVPDPRFNRFARYYLARFKMNASLISKKYSGTHTLYELDVDGDDVVLEYLGPDRKTVLEAFKSAQIALPGDYERTQKAMKIVFSDACKAEETKAPF